MSVADRYRDTPMTEDDAARIRMALAEAGYPHAHVLVEPHPLYGIDVVAIDPDVPPVVAWRAYCLTDAPACVMCLMCWAVTNSGSDPAWVGCHLPGNGVPDCGAERPVDDDVLSEWLEGWP